MSKEHVTMIGSHSLTEYLSQCTADPIQNALAPYAKRAVGELYGVPIQFEYVSLADAYNLIKRALEGNMKSAEARHD